MGTHDEDGKEPKPKHKEHKPNDKDREKKEKRDKKDKERSSKHSRHGGDKPRDVGRDADEAAYKVDDAADAAGAPSNGRLPSPSPMPPPKPAAAEAPAVVQRPEARADPVINDSGGEISMSIDETNRVRMSLGLKPLKAEGSDRKKKEQEADAARREDAAKAARAAELKERVDRAREKRLMQEDLGKVTTLGTADADDDSMAAWVARSRQAEEARRASERAAATRVATMYDEEDDEDDEDEDAKPSSADLVGLKVRHTAEEVGAGETVILTLADKGVLDEDDADELENVLAAEEKKRSKARKAATKTGKPLFGEDGVARGLLEKYDEEAEDEGMQIDESGVVPDKRARLQAEMRRRTAEAGESIANGAGPASYAGANTDYYTAEEMAQFIKPKGKKLKRKLRTKPADEEPEAQLTATDIAALEAAAMAAVSGDHGSRSGRGAEIAAKEAQQRLADLKARQDRYDRALQKANAATQQIQSAAASAAVAVDEDDDDFRSALDDSLRRAQRAAAAKPKSEDDIAHEVIARRQQDDAAFSQRQDVSEDLQLSEASEFTKLLKRGLDSDSGVAAPAAASTGMMGDDEDDDMDVPEPAPVEVPAVAPKAENRRFRRPTSGGWRTEGDEPPDSDAMDVEPPGQQEAGSHVKEEPEGNVTLERAVGSGLGGALALLKERGELNQSKAIVWSGRHNDMKPGKLQPVSDVFTGGNAEDEQANRIENALRRTDEFGRQKTPKEAWRELNYGFHGIDPSKNKKAKMQKKFAEDQARLRAATSEATGGLDRLRHVHAASATPYLVLSGNIKPGQISDPSSGFATSDKAVSLTPVLGAQTPALGGGITPLAGNRKVEAMLGIDRSAADRVAMPPPAARRTQR